MLPAGASLGADDGTCLSCQALPRDDRWIPPFISTSRSLIIGRGWKTQDDVQGAVTRLASASFA